MVRADFPSAFEQSLNAVTKRFLQQNSSMTCRDLDEMGAMTFAIPQWSPGLNPIENFFHLIHMDLKNNTIARHI